jgi:hypothetical protein
MNVELIFNKKFFVLLIRTLFLVICTCSILLFFVYSQIIKTKKPIIYEFKRGWQNATGRGGRISRIIIEFRNKDYTVVVSSFILDQINSGIEPYLYYSTINDSVFCNLQLIQSKRISFLSLTFFLILLIPKVNKYMLS